MRIIFFNNSFIILTFCIIFFFDICCCNSQNTDNMINRKPAVAGQFYSANPDTLKKDLDTLFSKAKPKQIENLRAIISPHAGYVYSGIVAASSYNQIDTTINYQNIFIIGTSHQLYLKGASVYNKGNYETPFREVEVNIDIANNLINNNPVFEFNNNAHKNEHSNEVQIPFLQYKLKNNFKIVPIIIGTNSVDSIKAIAKALKPYFTNENLFVISTDFSHYPDYEDAGENDKNTAESIITNSPDVFLKTINDNKYKNIANLATSICGWSATLTLLYLTENNDSLKYNLIEYQNSGDSFFGDKDRVVGYYSIAVSQQDNSFSLSEKEKELLLEIARNSINEYVKNSKTIKIDTAQLTKNLKIKSGAFVSLHKNGKLRGCIGRFGESAEIYKLVQEMAIAAATEDNRFLQVEENELDSIEIEISVLTPLKKITSLDEFEMGKHGIYIKKGYSSGTYLPQVAAQGEWTKEEFVSHCSKNKAGIGADGWKTADLYTYEAIIFSEEK